LASASEAGQLEVEEGVWVEPYGGEVPGDLQADEAVQTAPGLHRPEGRGLYLQTVLGYSAVTSGLSQLRLAVGVILAAGIASPLVTRYGARRLLVAGLALFAGGLLWFAQLPVHAN
jgi:MFS family permease